jgi:hypothetical protein
MFSPQAGGIRKGSAGLFFAPDNGNTPGIEKLHRREFFS